MPREKVYYVDFDGYGNGYQNSLENIKSALYELFGDVPIATDDSLMSGMVPVLGTGTEGESANTSAIHIDIVEETRE